MEQTVMQEHRHHQPPCLEVLRHPVGSQRAEPELCTQVRAPSECVLEEEEEEGERGDAERAGEPTRHVPGPETACHGTP
jgi:hypothetical protein